ncbi:MAG: DUF4258 domain-containing protein [Thermoplasmata archaeon]|nr:DUF4258 domain-containing protein [Thermoplasmata archaeon]
MDINEIKAKIKANKYDLTFHALKRRIERKISTLEIENAILNGEIIEEYPNDTPFPSCLINGFIRDKEPIHIVRAVADRINIITLYKPTENEWRDYKTRRHKK